MNCAPTAAQQAQIAAAITAVFIAINVLSLLAFYGWRRTRAPWRSVFFTVFALCALLVIDFFVYAVVPAPAAPAPVHACR